MLPKNLKQGYQSRQPNEWQINNRVIKQTALIQSLIDPLIITGPKDLLHCVVA